VAFRDGQLEAIQAIVEQRSRLLVVQRTGWGKSAVYFVATRLLRDRGAGTTIIVSPLLALMRDQIEAASRLHLNVATINSSNKEDWELLERDLLADTARVADWLNAKGIPAAAYSGETDPEIRLEIERQLKTNELKVVAATSALDMGFDKPDLAFVIHFQSPDSPVAYYQQVGRAGRAVDHAEVVLLRSERDEDIWQDFLETGLPVQWHAEQVVEYLEAEGDWVGQRDIEVNVNMPSSRIIVLLKVLDVEGAVEKERSKYRRTLRPWTFDSARIERVRTARLAEHQAMRNYDGVRRHRHRRRRVNNIDRSARGLTACAGRSCARQIVRHHVCRHFEQVHFSSVTQQPRRCCHGSTYGVAGNP
jgi:ATP-dependent DNA helicase RecQ